VRRRNLKNAAKYPEKCLILIHHLNAREITWLAIAAAASLLLVFLSALPADARSSRDAGSAGAARKPAPSLLHWPQK
jgi:hypothetical protein